MDLGTCLLRRGNGNGWKSPGSWRDQENVDEFRLVTRKTAGLLSPFDVWDTLDSEMVKPILTGKLVHQRKTHPVFGLETRHATSPPPLGSPLQWRPRYPHSPRPRAEVSGRMENIGKSPVLLGKHG